MPKSREVNSDTPCSFCGQRMEQVPLMVNSSVTNASVCSWCALGVIEQTFKHAMLMESSIRKATAPRPKIVPAGSAKVDKVDVAVNKALNHGK